MDRGNRERWIEVKRSVKCPLCRPNRGCNQHGKRHPKSDKHKNHRR